MARRRGDVESSEVDRSADDVLFVCEKVEEDGENVHADAAVTISTASRSAVGFIILLLL